MLLYIILAYITWTDLQAYYIPDWACIIIAILACIQNATALPILLYGGLCAAGLMLSLYYSTRWWYKQEAIGFGDVKLITVLGLFFGPLGILKIAYASILLAGVYAIGLLLAKQRPAYIPFAPFISLSTLGYSLL